MTYQPQPVHPDVIVIDIQEFFRVIQCAMCGREDGSHWGLPVCSETGVIIANDDPRDWGAIPACRDCWAAHEHDAFVGQWPKF